MLAHWVSNRFIFFPSRYPEGDWNVRGPASAQDLWFRASDGTRLNAWWFPSGGGGLATLFLHGNAGNVTCRVDHAMRIREAGSASLVLDYRGYGKSEGQPSEDGLYRDALAAYEELVRLGFDSSRIVLHGESLGTAVAVDLAARCPCAGLILESPLLSCQRIAAGIVPWLGPALVRGFDSRRKIRRVQVPLLVIHGDADEIVPFEHGRALFEAANDPKEFWRLPGGTHNELLDVAGTEYVPRLKKFYATCEATLLARRQQSR